MEKGESNYAEMDGSGAFVIRGRDIGNRQTFFISGSKQVLQLFSLYGSFRLLFNDSLLFNAISLSRSCIRFLDPHFLPLLTHLPFCILSKNRTSLWVRGLSGLINTGLTMCPIIMTFHLLHSLVFKAVTSDIADGPFSFLLRRFCVQLLAPWQF